MIQYLPFSLEDDLCCPVDLVHQIRVHIPEQFEATDELLDPLVVLVGVCLHHLLVLASIEAQVVLLGDNVLKIHDEPFGFELVVDSGGVF